MIRIGSGQVFSAEISIVKGFAKGNILSRIRKHSLLFSPFLLIKSSEAMSVDSLCTVYHLNQSVRF